MEFLNLAVGILCLLGLFLPNQDRQFVFLIILFSAMNIILAAPLFLS